MSTAIISTTTNEVTTRHFDTSILAGQLKPSSIAMYTRDFGAYLEFAGSFAVAMQAETLAQWRTHLANETTKSPNTINRMLSAVKRLTSEAAQQGYTSHENAEAFGRVQGVKVKAMRNRRKQDARTRITPEDMRRIVNQPDRVTLAGKMHYALLSVLAATGMRISEAVSLTVNQLVWETNEDTGRSGWVCVLKEGKTLGADEEHHAPLTSEAYSAIQAWLSCRPVTSEYIFTGFTGRGSRGPRTTPVTPQSAWEMVKRYTKAAGIENVKPHDFRRFVGTQLARRDIRVAQKVLGHKRLETTAAHYVLDAAPVGETEGLY